MTGLQKLISTLKMESDIRIVMYIIDGLGGLPGPNGKTELAEAYTPNLDKLAKNGSCGLISPVAAGITPGSGPAHLSLFGYDPVVSNVKRGVLAAFGIGFDMKPGDIAARVNFATLDKDGKIADRRAGRISSEENRRICNELKNIRIGETDCYIKTVKEHRALVVFRGGALSDALADTDPQMVGVAPLPVRTLSDEALATANIVSDYIDEIKRRLVNEQAANGVLLRGFSGYRRFLSMEDIYGLKAIAIASYPMYRGIARLVGMTLAPPYRNLEEAARQYISNADRFSFFFIHYKYADSRGEDGDFPGKVHAIEDADKLIPSIAGNEKTVVIVTGDHSTPSQLASHSWHPVPFLIHGKYVRPDYSERFSEKECLHGALGIFPSTEIMALAMANSLKLAKFGA